MKTKKQYLFRSERLGFRNWINEDLDQFALVNSDTEVMEHFPNLLSIEEIRAFIERLQKHYSERKYTYFATEILETGEFIGFIGLVLQSFESLFTPATDIGWRLKKSSWGNGYATEGASRCLQFAFYELNIERIIATCTINNSKSEKVMQKIGMSKKGEFNHPQLKEFPDHERCVCYEITNKDFCE